ncbi:MAG: IPT/TIG domain-containing protein [Verrucomicrobiia bacterium]
MNAKRMRRRLAMIVIAGAFCLSGCSLLDRDYAYHKAADDLDYVERWVDRWGQVTISDILFVPNTGQFKIDYATNVDFYVSQARQEIQGGERVSNEQFREILSSLNVQLTQPISPATAAIPAGGSNTPTAVAAALPAPMGQQNLASSAFSALQQLTQQAPSISERQAVMIGFNDKIAELLLKILADPEVVPTNFVVLIGTMQVSCQPGWQTRRGYIADVNVTMEFSRDEGVGNKTHSVYSTDPDQQDEQPSVLAVLPLIDSQRLDLRNSQRNQFELAAQLALSFAAKGVNVQAQQLYDYLKRQEGDTVTRTASPLATSYTDSTSFGFQLYPSLTAVEDTSRTYGGAGATLDAISFPAVVAVAIHKEDVLNDDGTWKWTNYVFETQSRWIPRNHGMPLQTNRERVEMARRLDFVADRLDPHKKDTVRFPMRNVTVSNEDSFARGELRNNFRALSELGTSAAQEFPLAPLIGMATNKLGGPVIASVAPTSGWVNAPTVFTIQGSNFAKNAVSAVKAVSVGGRPCDILYAGEHTVIAVLPAGRTNEVSLGSPGPAKLVLATSAGMATSPEDIGFERRETSTLEYPSVSILRDDKGSITNLTVLRSGMNLTNLLEYLAPILTNTQKTNSAAGQKTGGGSGTTNATITLTFPVEIPNKQ